MTSKGQQVQLRFDRNANTIDVAAHCGKIIHYMAPDIRPSVTSESRVSGSKLDDYRKTCRKIIRLMDDCHVNLLSFVSNSDMCDLNPREQMIVRLVAASRLQEDICRAQSLGSAEGHKQAEETREVLSLILNQVRDEHYEGIVPITITYWLQMNKGVYEGPPHAPQPDDH